MRIAQASLPLLLAGLFTAVSAQEQSPSAPPNPAATEIWTPVPAAVSTGVTSDGIPSDAIVLFDGTSLDEWRSLDGSPAGWVVANGVMSVATQAGDIRTARAFGDIQLHIEWQIPQNVSGQGQARGNSGVYLQSRYEIQILDSFDNETYANGQAASVYKQHVPLVNASRPPGEWQVYDVVYRAPTFSGSGAVSSPARLTLLHNGVLVQDNVALWGPTQFIGLPQYEAHGATPLLLQAHGSGSIVNFRNVWVREL